MLDPTTPNQPVPLVEKEEDRVEVENQGDSVQEEVEEVPKKQEGPGEQGDGEQGSGEQGGGRRRRRRSSKQRKSRKGRKSTKRGKRNKRGKRTKRR